MSVSSLCPASNLIGEGVASASYYPRSPRTRETEARLILRALAISDAPD
jgi:hypothetical protein